MHVVLGQDPTTEEEGTHLPCHCTKRLHAIARADGIMSLHWTLRSFFALQMKTKRLSQEHRPPSSSSLMPTSFQRSSLHIAPCTLSPWPSKPALPAHQLSLTASS